MSRRSQFAVGKAIRGGRPQRLLFASTGTKDPKASDVLYIKELVAPLTVNTMPEGTLKAFANHGELGATVPADGGNCETVLAQFSKAGVDCDALATKLQDEGTTSFVKSWNELMAVIASKSASLQKSLRKLTKCPPAKKTHMRKGESVLAAKPVPDNQKEKKENAI